MKLNEMKSINKTLTEEFKAKEIQSLSFFLAMLIDKTEYMLSAGPVSNDEV